MCQHYFTFIKLYIYCSVERNSQDNISYCENILKTLEIKNHKIIYVGKDLQDQVELLTQHRQVQH